MICSTGPRPEGAGLGIDLTIRPATVVKPLALAVLLLTLAGIPATLAPYSGIPLPERTLRFLALLNLDREANLPSWFSSAQLFIAGCLLAIVAAANSGKEFRGRWALLAAIFIYMSMDETVTVHERFNRFTAGIDRPAALHFGWLVFALPIVAALAFAYWPLLWRLPARIRVISIAAACMYLGGAVGIEMISGAWKAAYGQENFTYAALSVPEEVLEMAGVTVWIFALLTYLQHDRVCVSFRSPAASVARK